MRAPSRRDVVPRRPGTALSHTYCIHITFCFAVALLVAVVQRIPYYILIVTHISLDTVSNILKNIRYIRDADVAGWRRCRSTSDVPHPL
jgi:hypothetical protein